MLIGSKKPSEFTEEQWILARQQQFLRMLSAITVGFSPQFISLYIMQHMDMAQKSINSMAVTVTAMAAGIMVLQPFIKKYLVQIQIPTIWVITFIIIGCDFLVLEHPVMVLLTLSISVGLLHKLAHGGWSVLSNRCYQGDAKTTFGFMVDSSLAVGTALASLLCWVFSDVKLEYIVYADMVLTVIDTLLVILRLHLLKRECRRLGLPDK